MRRPRLLTWPDGLLWRLTEAPTKASRERRFALFMRTVAPSASSTVLDVGVSDFNGRSTNFFEVSYPWRSRIVAVAHGRGDEFLHFRRAFPEIRLVLADGRSLPFADGEFDVVFSNAVIEHVGRRDQQARFISECLRVGGLLYLSTPNARFPVDAHTLLPFVHWLPRSLRHRIYHTLGLGYWADVAHLNLLDRATLLRMFPPGSVVRVLEDRVWGLTTSFVVIARRRGATVTTSGAGD